MSLCPYTNKQCCCQPQDGVMCPNGPQPPFEPWKPEPAAPYGIPGQPASTAGEKEAFMAWARANLAPGQITNIEDAMERGESVSFQIWLGARGVSGPDGESK